MAGQGFKWCGDLNGGKAIVREVYVPAGTAIEKGEPIQYSQGTGVIVHAGPTDFDDPVYAVSNEAHDGSTSGRQSGTALEVTMVTPSSLFRYRAAKAYTLTGGSTTTAVDSSLLPQTNSFWKGGAIQIISCAADSTLNGRIVRISDSTGSSGTLTLAETLPAALASGDTIYICPGYMAHDYLGYDMDSDCMNPDFDANGGAVLRIYETNPDIMEMVVRFERSAVVS